MSELIDRYVHQVGQYVHPKERREIEAELRSQIQDQLDDRYGGSATEGEVVAALKQLGDPRTMAASYSGGQYLVGPELYPVMMTVLRFGLPLVPSVVVIVNLIGAALSPDGANWLGLLIGSLFTAAQAALLFIGVVVGFFAILQHSGETLWGNDKQPFDPLQLPPADDAHSVDRFEASVGIATGTLVSIALLYYLQVGGLTLRFNLNDPGEVLPVPVGWLVVVLLTAFGGVLLSLWALLRRRWTLTTWGVQSALNLLGAVGLYFVLFRPILGRLLDSAPALGDYLSLDSAALMLTLSTVVVIALANGYKLIRLWQHRQGAAA